MITGAELRAARKKAGLTQAQLAAKTRFARGAVIYWEKKTTPFLIGRVGAVPAFAEHVDLSVYCSPNAHALQGFTDPQQDRLNQRVAKENQRIEEQAAHYRATRRIRCRAKTRKGHPCKMLSEAGRYRCKFHGGMSTGPRTPEGKARISAAQKKRWAEYRKVKGGS